jgi:hypothetical protein
VCHLPAAAAGFLGRLSDGGRIGLMMGLTDIEYSLHKKPCGVRQMLAAHY